MGATRGLPCWLTGILGAVALVLLWWLFSATAFTPAPGTTFTPVPTPWAVAQQLLEDGLAPYWTVFQVTITEALLGFAIGNGIALALSALVLLVPRLEPVITQLAVVTYCLPIVAVGGIAIVILGGAKRAGDPSATAIFLAALAVFFTTVVGALVGFKAADRAALDVVRVYGGGRFAQLRKVRLVAALPAAGPAAWPAGAADHLADIFSRALRYLASHPEIVDGAIGPAGPGDPLACGGASGGADTGHPRLAGPGADHCQLRRQPAALPQQIYPCPPLASGGRHRHRR